MRRHNLTAHSRVLDQSIREAEEAAATALQIAVGDPVFVRNGFVWPTVSRWAFRPRIFRRNGCWVIEENSDTGSLYEMLQARYGLHPAKARETHFALLAPAEQAGLLGIAAGSPALGAERIAYLPGGGRSNM